MPTVSQEQRNHMRKRVSEVFDAKQKELKEKHTKKIKKFTKVEIAAWLRKQRYGYSIPFSALKDITPSTKLVDLVSPSDMEESFDRKAYEKDMRVLRKERGAVLDKITTGKDQQDTIDSFLAFTEGY